MSGVTEPSPARDDRAGHDGTGADRRGTPVAA